VATVPELRGARVRLRGLRADDAAAVLGVFADPETSDYFAADFSDPEQGRAMVERRLAYVGPPGTGHWAIDLDGTLIGLAHLRPSWELPGEVAEIGWYLDPAHSGRGLATEASAVLLEHGLRTLGLPAVWALIHESNTASLALARRLGFLDVGTGTHYGAAHRVQVALAPRRPPGMHHVELWVPDLAATERSLGWILGELGWQENTRWRDGVSWRLGDTYVVAECSPALTATTHERCRPGLNHLALHAGSREQVDSLVSKCAGHGWSLMFADRHPHAGGPEHYAAFLEDEQGFEVEIVAPPRCSPVDDPPE
jgi:RimJ/RimL family protein N-acetyltransferase/catechol 2,3-dioxygenase-like lactoylglutathione lyase family enzyme